MVMGKEDTLRQSCLSSQKAIHLHSQNVLVHSAFAAWLGTWSHQEHLGPQPSAALRERQEHASPELGCCLQRF